MASSAGRCALSVEEEVGGGTGFGSVGAAGAAGAVVGGGGGG